MKIGIVGYGSIGKRHARNALALGHEVLVYDPLLQPSSRVAFERNIYDQCDAVIVATPSMHHEAGLRACIERGRPVLIEKPISISLGTLPALLDRADEKSLVVMMGCNLRFHPCVQQVKLWLAAGDIGMPRWANFICATESRDPGRDGVVMNVGAHEVDIAQYFFGPGTCVSAYADAAASAVFVLQHETGVRSVFHLDYATQNRIREFWIAGDEKNIGVDLDARQMSLGNKASLAPGSYDDDYMNELRGFTGRIGGVFAPGASGRDGLATLRTLLDIKKKAGIS